MRCLAAPRERVGVQVVPKALLLGARHMDEAAVLAAVQQLGQRCARPGMLTREAV